MVVDYDSSDLPDDQAESWGWLRTDEICGLIIAAQTERLGFHLALGHRIASAMIQKPQAIFNSV